METGDIREFSSMTDAGIYLGVSRVSIRKYLLNNIPYKGYIISKAPVAIDNETTKVLSTSNYIEQQPILLTNKITGICQEFSSIKEAAEFLDISTRSGSTMILFE